MVETDSPYTQVQDLAPDVTAPVPKNERNETAPLAQPAKRGGFFSLVLGGLIAAGLGFGLAQYVPNGWPFSATANLDAQLKAQAAQIAALQARFENLPQHQTLDPTIFERIKQIEAQVAPDLDPIDKRLGALETRLGEIESMPADATGVAPAAIAALQAEVQALRDASVGEGGQVLAAETEARLKEAQTAAEALKADAEKLAKASRQQIGLGQLRAALDGGGSYADVLIEYEADLGSVPAILAENAGVGVPSLFALQETFPAAARIALDDALRADLGQTLTERASSFLRNQTGARSLEPREGTDPDAILSRAEAALAANDLPTALLELAGLPDVAQTAMAEWRTTAETRILADRAFTEFSASIGK